MLEALPLAAPDSVSDSTFNLYVAFLALSGILLLALGAINIARQSTGMRILNLLVGAGFLGYAIYLFFIFEGGEFRMFVYAFIAPVLLIISAFRGRKAQTSG